MDARSKLSDFLGLPGKVAIVTGGAQGIGKATVLRLAEAGAHVVIADLNREQGEKTARLVADNGGSAEVAVLDVTDTPGANALVERVASERGRVDVLVNNAGMYPIREFAAIDDALWLKTLDVNVVGAARLARAVIPHMKKQGGGVIVNLASISSFQPHGNMVHYDTSKAAVVMLTRALAWELRGSNIRVNAVAPGGIATPGSMQTMPKDPNEAIQMQEYAKAFFARIPTGRMGKSDDVARAIMFFCTPMSEYVNGAVLIVDGGFLLS